MTPEDQIHETQETPPPPGRVVAIVGRPNVGKSALFNRIAGRRKAIVHAQSGVTRDRLMEEVTWDDERFDLIDTGGVCAMRGTEGADIIERGILAQVDAALADAAVAILVVDIDAGRHPMDEEVAAILHDRGCPTVIAANKADAPQHETGSADFEGLGFPVFPVSAVHNRGIGSMMTEVLKQLPEGENETIENPLKVAVVGRPNVGKSSYINRLLRCDRVIVSDIPGTTRDTIDVPFVVGHGKQARHYILTDTAGMRRRGKIDSSVERFSLFRATRSIDRADVCVLVLDAQCGPTAHDRKIAASIIDAGKGCVILVNKWDLSEETQRAYGPQIAQSMPFMEFCPVVFASAQSGYNVRKSVEAIDYVASQIRATLPTGILNRTILDACERVHAPVIKGKPLKIFYATQTGVEPIRIAVFVNDPRKGTDNFKKYLIRTLREKFGLEGAPVRLQLRARRAPRHLADGK